MIFRIIVRLNLNRTRMPNWRWADAALRKRVAALAAATALVRDLINAPANHLTPKAIRGIGA